MLTESELRKSGFQEGHWVELADSQKWCFPKPRIRFKPKFVDGKIEVGGGPTFGPEFDANLDILFGITDAEPIDRLRIKFEMAVKLLLTNYDLTPEQLSELIVLEPDDPASDARWEQLTSVIMGLSPKKPTPDGSVSPE